MPLADWKTVFDIAQSIATVLAILAAGGWALYALLIFRQREAAITALRKTEAEAAALQYSAKRLAVLDIRIECTSRRDARTGGHVLLVTVIASNTGIAPALLRLDEGPPIRVQRVEFDATGRPVFTGEPQLLGVRKATEPSKLTATRVIRAGGVSRLPGILRLSEPGVYFVSFRVPMDEQNRAAMIEAGSRSDRNHSWTASSYVMIPGDASRTGQGASVESGSDEAERFAPVHS